MILDLSRWQGVLDAAKAKAAGVVGVILRATIGDYYTDSMFAENWQRAADEGLLVGGYHVFKPSIAAVRQIQHYIDVIGARVPDFPHTIDVELDDNLSNSTVTNCLKACMPYIPRVRGKLPAIYTRKYWWDDNIINDGTDWTIYPLHVAHYTTNLVPLLPRSWSTWAIHQYSADGNGLGNFYGVQSADVDLNRFNGDEAALRAYCGLTTPFPPVPAPEWPRAVISRGDPRPLRYSPSTMAEKYGNLPPALRVLAYQEMTVNGDVWLRLTPAGEREIWTARIWQGNELMRFV